MASQAITPFSQSQQPRKHSNLIPGGNPGGRPRTSIFRKHAMRELLVEVEGTPRIAGVITSQIDLASSGGRGSTAAAEFLRDTVDGKPGQDVAAAGGVTIVLANDVAAFAAEAFADELEE